MKIYLAEKDIAIQTDSNPLVSFAITSLPNRRYLPKRGEWRVPKNAIVQTLDSLSTYDFDVSDEAEELYVKWKQKMLKLARFKRGELLDSEKKILKKLKIPLLDYQAAGSGFLASSVNGLCGDQPGLGKTIQSIAAINLKNCKKVLVLCPLSVKKTWQEEVEKWDNGATCTIINGTAEKREVLWKEQSKYLISNYHLLLRDSEYFKDLEFDAVICDEATAISNPSAKTTAAVKKLKTARRIALTGTPISNFPEDVWSIMDWLYKGYLGSFSQFKERFCMIENGIIVGYKNLEELHKKIELFMIRRLKKDVLSELPPKTIENRWVEFSASERKMYTAIQRAIREELKEVGMLETSNISIPAVKMVRLRQAVDSLELVSESKESSKLLALRELLKEVLIEDEKAIIFTTFREMADILMRELNSYKPLLIAGNVSEEDRTKNRQEFNTNEKNRLLIMTSAGSVGINLQRASIVIHYDLPWSISSLEQREDRAHRHGQKRSVFVYNLLVEDSIDNYVLSLLQKKREFVDNILGDNSSVAKRVTSIHSSDVKDLLS